MSEAKDHPDCPVRSYMDDPEISWKTEKPNYALTDQAYLDGRSRQHKADSLEKLVENLVKTWEMESTHKVDLKDWGTIEPKVYRFCTNGGRKFTAEDNLVMGNYNMLMENSPLFDTQCQTNESSHTLFKKCFPGGFPWELQDLLSGPPRVSFTWRHWAKWTGAYMDQEPTGEMLELYGVAIAEVNENLKITDLKIFYDPNPMLLQFYGGRDKCPFLQKIPQLHCRH